MEGESNSQLERIFVILLVMLFASGSLLSLSGIWSEIPVLVALGLPEGNRINSYIIILAQIGSLGIVAFLICNKCSTSTRVYRPEIPVIYIVMFVGSIGTFLMIFLWDTKTYFSGGSTPHSVAFLTIILIIAFVDMTAVTTFFGFMSLMKPEYLNWYWIGQGMGNILPACVVLIQQSRAGNHKVPCVANYTFVNETVIGNLTLTYNCTSWREASPEFLFGPEEYFGLLFMIMLASYISFISLNTLPCARREYAHQRDGHHLKRDGCGGLFSASDNLGEREELVSFNPLTLPNLDGVATSGTDVDGNFVEGDLFKWQLGFLYSMSFLNLAVLYGILAPLQGYSGSAYGSHTYGLVMPLREITGSLAFLVFLLKPVYSFKVVAWSLLLGCISGVYCIVVAAMSPEPPFKNLVIGKVLIVLAWMSAGLFLSYSRAAVSWILRHSSESRRHLIMNGAVGQIGQLIASIIMYLLVNVYDVFVEYDDQERCPIDPTCIRS